MKRHWRNVAIVHLICAQKVIATKCHTKFVFDEPVWRPVGVSTVGLWTCWCVDLSACPPVGVSSCRRVDFRRVDLPVSLPVVVSACRCVDLSAIDLSVYLLTILFINGWMDGKT